MNTEILGVILQWVALVGLCYPLGRYMAKVYKGERTWLDFMAPVEKWVYKLCGINPEQEMNWKQFLKALLMVGCRSIRTATRDRLPSWRSTPASRSW